jgi:hypothetical protein
MMLRERRGSPDTAVDHDCNGIAVNGDPRVGWAAIIRAVSRYSDDTTTDLIQ